LVFRTFKVAYVAPVRDGAVSRPAHDHDKKASPKNQGAEPEGHAPQCFL